jgi:menaquinone-dependent protoporphyrinogen IX oxidase
MMRSSRNGDLDAELKYSTRELREYDQANPVGLTHANKRWQHYDKVELAASVVLEDYELFFLNCHAYGSEQYEAILMREDSGMMLRSFPASREMGITLAYVQSAFVTGAWSTN